MRGSNMTYMKDWAYCWNEFGQSVMIHSTLALKKTTCVWNVKVWDKDQKRYLNTDEWKLEGIAVSRPDELEWKQNVLRIVKTYLLDMVDAQRDDIVKAQKELTKAINGLDECYKQLIGLEPDEESNGV